MAQIYPQWISNEERKRHPDRRAEYKVYDTLSSLGDRWLILYGSALKWVSKYGVRDRETEFIIAHPEIGVLALEVKGGLVKRKDSSWFQCSLSELTKPDDKRNWHELNRNPYTQVTDAAKDYSRFIKDYIKTQRLKPWDFEIGTVVCFPDMQIPSDDYLGADAPRELTIDCRDLEDIQNRLYEIMKLYQKRPGSEPGEEGINLIKRVLARDWYHISSLGYQIDSAELQRKELTQEQFDILYQLEDNPKMLISGCAGSGKTMIAAEKARRLAEQGAKVLYTCFNENLATFLRQSPLARQQNLLIYHFHALCYQLGSLCQAVKLPTKVPDDPILREDYFNIVLPEALALAALEPSTSFDAIIIDEGQDFSPDWISTITELLKEPDQGNLYLFYDDNQRIYNRGKMPFSWPKYRLTRNMRNTNPIFEIIKQYYYSPERIRPSGIDGPEPWFFSLEEYSDEYESIQAIIGRLTEQGVNPKDIVLLTPRAKDKSCFKQKRIPPGNFPIVWKLGSMGKQVSCSSIYQFKGLEKKVVVLVELDHLFSGSQEELIYVGVSRARSHLVVLGKLPK